MIRLILVGILLLLSLLFFLQNQEQEVTFRYFSLFHFGMQEASTPIYKPILSAFALGLLVASILLFPAWVRGRIDLRRKTKADLDRLRNAMEKPPRPPQSPRAQEITEEIVDE